MGLNTEIRQIVREVIAQEVPKHVASALQARPAPPQRPGPPRVYTVADVAEATRADVKTVRAWIAKGLLRAVRKDGMKEYRISESDLLAFYAANGYRPEDLDIDKEASRVLASALGPKKRE
jgi:excisionase family DNA binding protein